MSPPTNHILCLLNVMIKNKNFSKDRTITYCISPKYWPIPIREVNSNLSEYYIQLKSNPSYLKELLKNAKTGGTGSGWCQTYPHGSFECPANTFVTGIKLKI